MSNSQQFSSLVVLQNISIEVLFKEEKTVRMEGSVFWTYGLEKKQCSFSKFIGNHSVLFPINCCLASDFHHLITLT